MNVLITILFIGLIGSVISNIIIFCLLQVTTKHSNEVEKMLEENIKEGFCKSSYIRKLEMENKRLRRMQYSTCNCKNFNVSTKNIKEAIRFAMSQAHPDNPNGSNERFIKYKELYDNL